MNDECVPIFRRYDPRHSNFRTEGAMKPALGVILFFLFISWGFSAEKLTPRQVEKICERYNHADCKMVAAIAMVESAYNPNAYNEKEDAVGLMQLKCSTAKAMGLKYSCKQLFSPVINIRFGSLYLKHLSEKQGLILERYLIASYNAGRVRYCKSMRRNKWMGGGNCIPGHLINEFYVFKVTRILNYLRSQG